MVPPIKFLFFSAESPPASRILCCVLSFVLCSKYFYQFSSRTQRALEYYRTRGHKFTSSLSQAFHAWRFAVHAKRALAAVQVRREVKVMKAAIGMLILFS
jgi:hypothetical protein